MKSLTLLSFLALVSAVAAHTYLSHVTFNGKCESEGTCIRPYWSTKGRNWYVVNDGNDGMICGIKSLNSSATKTCVARASSDAVFEWHHDNDNASDNYITYDHKCACTVNMAPAATNGLGASWFKVFEYGYDAVTNKWCTDLIHEGGGKVNFTIPADIKDGDYIVRGEFKCPTLKGVVDSSFVNCAHISVTGGGNAEPKGYDIIKTYLASKESRYFARNKNFTTYPIPGPPVYIAGSSSKQNAARTISDELREIQNVTMQFQSQLDKADGTIGLHPFGPVNASQSKEAFSQTIGRLRTALTAYRDSTLTSWSGLLANSVNSMQMPDGNPNPLATAVLGTTNRAVASAQELSTMRQSTDNLHVDLVKCKMILMDSAAASISTALESGFKGDAELLVERAKALANKLGLASYTDEQTSGGAKVTTVTLAGEILVIDVDLSDSVELLKVKVSYASETEHDERIDALMLSRLKKRDIHGFEQLIEEMAELDKLTKVRTPANFLHNMFAMVATLKEIQKQELAALDGDVKQLLRYGSGISLPHTCHVGASSLLYVPAVLKAGISDAGWAQLATSTYPSMAVFDKCNWLHFGWEPAQPAQCFLSALFQQHCLSPEYMIEDSASHRVVSSPHPTIHGLQLRFLEFIRRQASPHQMQVDSGAQQPDFDDKFWIPYRVVAKLAPSMPACAQTVRKLMVAASISSEAQDAASIAAGMQDSPRLLEDAPTLEYLVCQQSAKKGTCGTSGDPKDRTLPKVVHNLGGDQVTVEMEPPQIRAWSIERIPLHHPRNIVSIVPILRRQAVFNELLSSCFSQHDVDNSSDELSSNIHISARAFASDPFRIDFVICRLSEKEGAVQDAKRAKVSDTAPEPLGSSQKIGVILRVVEATGDIQGWTHQNLGIAPTSADMAASLSTVAMDSLTAQTANRALSKVANLSHSIPMIASWLNMKQ
ncbi:hypothetical protein FBU59_000134 [Linderina macrospora]|uniref:Uncharacterized protein n=1 Tax=Linderina macrospora TaxID=4868 RepID=A0ACC1JHG0_9FUNG|nr:hypothetical protein FBU59_000134 [Linderina macrospora]